MRLIKKNLKTTHPELCKEWDYDKNKKGLEYYTKGSNKKVGWKCTEGHEWEAIIKNRSKGMGCPYCSGNKVLERYNDLKTINPKLCKEWDYVKNKKGPECYSVGSTKKVWWKCTEGHEWEAIIASRSNGCCCPYCSGNKVLEGYNDLKTTHSELCEEWNYDKNKKRPECYSAGSTKKVWWKCKKDHEWESIINKRTKGIGCPYCSGQKTLKGYNDLKTTNSELCKEWNCDKNEKGSECYSAGSGKKVWWKCTEDHEWKATINKRTNGSGCPKCLYKSQTITEKILKENFPNKEIVSQHRLKKPITNEFGETIQKSVEIDFKITLNKKIKIFVEYNGEQHYKETSFFHREKGRFEQQQQRDRWLRNYCKENNIILIEIDGRKYKTEEEIEPYLLKEMLFEIIQFNKRNKTL